MRKLILRELILRELILRELILRKLILRKLILRELEMRKLELRKLRKWVQDPRDLQVDVAQVQPRHRVVGAVRRRLHGALQLDELAAQQCARIAEPRGAAAC
jgi:hypothetical protein